MNSYWVDTTKNVKKYDRISKDIETEVCIIGGGITGVSIAYKLQKQNLKVTLLEKGVIGMQTTGNSTAKITSQHGLFYKYLKISKGEEFAKMYYEANETAIRDMEQIIEKEKIECNLEKENSYVVATKEEEVQKIKDEVDTVKSFGGDVRYIDKEEIDKKLPTLKPLAGIEFENQAQFNPYKYVTELAKICNDLGAEIYENTKAVDVKNKDDYYFVETEDGYVIKAKYLVIATKYPIVNMPGFYFMKMYQSTSYGISMRVNEKLIDGMYITSTNPKISLRMAKDESGYVLIVVGSDHKTGEKIDLTNSYKSLENVAKKICPEGKIKNYWNTEDCITLDKIPYIGKFSTMWENAYVATGFNKWGITTSNIASSIITDMITKRKNRYEDIFTSTRVEPIKNRQELGEMLKETVNSLIVKKLVLPDTEKENLKVEEGKIIEIDGEKIGAYKDKEGKIYMVAPKCAHLGCELTWNNLEKTWDCPCHGSRYDYTGKMLYGPTVKDLYKI